MSLQNKYYKAKINLKSDIFLFNQLLTIMQHTKARKLLKVNDNVNFRK